MSLNFQKYVKAFRRKRKWTTQGKISQLRSNQELRNETVRQKETIGFLNVRAENWTGLDWTGLTRV